MSLIGIVGFGAVAVVVVAWLIVSFTQPSPRRTIIEWVATVGMYVALLSLFVNLSLRAQEAGNTFALVAFGFLVLLFAVGLGMALVQLVKALGGGESKAVDSATN